MWMDIWWNGWRFESLSIWWYSDISDEFDRINKSRIFSNGALESAFSKSDYNTCTIKQMLLDVGYSVVDEVEIIDKEKLKEINSKYTFDYAEAKIDAEPMISPMIDMRSSLFGMH
mgnify:CR=1 FL=1